MRRKTIATLVAVVSGLGAGPASGDVLEFDEKAEWIAAVGDFTTIGFTEVEPGTIVTTQYAELGVIFADGDDIVNCCSDITFPQDGVGLDGNGDITLVFDTPQLWIAADFPGFLQIELFAGDQLIYTSVVFGASPVGNFGGLVSSEPFDSVVLIDDFGTEAAIDDLHFGPVPCPADVDGNALVDGHDLRELLAAWGTDPGGPPDVDGDGTVGIIDFLGLLGAWGPCAHFVDCNADGTWDLREVWDGTSPDCNGNGVPDGCDLDRGTSPDCNGNGIPDECDLDDGTSVDCNTNGVPDECDLADGTSGDCNADGVPDECEPDCNVNGIPDACDIADGTSSDRNGNGIPDACEFTNDCCEDAITINDRPTPFSTVGADTDGVSVQCDGGQGIVFVRDVWFRYTAPCTGFATFSVCNDADFDTRLAVYFDASCPPTTAIACSDNAPGCGTTSELEQFVGEGLTYLIRIGGPDLESHGTGVLSVSCEPLP